MIEESKFQDAEDYNFSFNKEQLTFRDIVLQHLKRISIFASVEMRGGYLIEKSKSFGGGLLTEQIYIPDTREVYSNAVDYLADILAPYFDKVMKEEEHNNIEELEKSRKLYYEGEEYKDRDNDIKKQNYRLAKMEIKRKLFRALCCFLFRKKYLELGKIED